MPGPKGPGILCLRRFYDMHKGAVVSAFFELNRAVSQCKKREVPANADIVARVETGTSLPDNDIARPHHLAAESFYS